MRPTRNQPTDAGFTLIEIVIAITIMALLAAGVALSFNRPMNKARRVQAIEQVRYLDVSSRDFARRFGRNVEIAFDLSENRLERREGASHDATFSAQIGSPFRIDAVWTVRERVDDGEAAITVSSLGVSQSYAVKLSGPDGATWVIMSGLAGETATYANDEQVQAIFAKIAPRRDAD
jgi:prepilin-type N-terminal cleavage/methylation domain-containing protein